MLTYHRSRLIRFFGQRRRLLSPTQGNIDIHHGVGDQHALAETVPCVNVRRGAPYFVRGWAIDFTRKHVPWDIVVEIDGRIFPARTRLGLPRPDVASSFGPDLLSSGFTFTFDTRSLALGPHDLTVRAIVGRRGAAYASIQDSARFFVLDAFPPSLPRRADLAQPLETYHIDPIALVPTGSVFELSGWALDERGTPITSVAAQIDDNPWTEGWTGVQRAAGARAGAQRAGFCVRIPLALVAPGTHILRLAGKGAAGRWSSLGQRTEFIVTTTTPIDLRWARALIDSGHTTIADEAGQPLTRIVLYRVSTAVGIRGTLSRSTPLGPAVSLVARADDDGGEFVLPAWSAPTSDPTRLDFGAELTAAELPPKTYRLFVDAPDVTHRFNGRSDPGCVLIVRPNARHSSVDQTASLTE